MSWRGWRRISWGGHVREGGEIRYGPSIVPDVGEAARELLDCWRSTGVSSEELAGMLVGASRAYLRTRSEQSVRLVWTGPSTDLVTTRRTEQVMLEVVEAARSRIFLTSFVAHGVGPVVRALASALERGVEVSILLESSVSYGGAVSVDSIGSMRRVLPEAKFYHWQTKEGDFVGGRVHAKVVVADDRVCFISSANLTEYAMEKNMEAGVLIRGGDVPRRLSRHLYALVTTGVIAPTRMRRR